MKLNIKDTFNTELPADKNKNNTRRQVTEACFSYVRPVIPSQAKIIHVSDLTNQLGITTSDVQSEKFKNIFTGSEVYKGSQPYAMCYGGHQFGHWAGQLGDGRAINLMEVEHGGKQWALQLKGAGETPYSRTADGLAVLRSSIREHLCSEAMHHLGVPTTRSLSLALSGDQVFRDMMYDGNGAYEKGAIVCRVAPSFIRFGNFQIFTSRQDHVALKKLTDYTIKHFFPNITNTGPAAYIEFFNAVLDLTLDMIIEWQRVGFVHGVMNTDNMSILGLTIDYGPYGWLEGYDPGWTPNTTDRHNARYRFGNQANIALWNLYQLANALFPIIQDAKPLEKALERYKASFAEKYFDMMRSKLGLANKVQEDIKLVQSLEKVMTLSETDMTIFFRNCASIKKTMSPEDALVKLNKAFYKPNEISDSIRREWLDWLQMYLERLGRSEVTDEKRRLSMNTVNPKYVLRNYMAQLAIDKADEGDYSMIAEMYELLKKPYAEQLAQEKWFAKRPEWARHKVGCSMLSCSS